MVSRCCDFDFSESCRLWQWLMFGGQLVREGKMLRQSNAE
jgi:hypothetical protein